jgi:O-antigen/teichoic acid export membrane protein
MIGLLSDLAISILYGQEYLPASLPMKIFAWSTGFSYLGVARTAWMQCKKQTRYETYIALFGAIINITLNYILILRFGIIGAACAAVLTQFMTNFIFLFFIKDIRGNGKLILDAIMLKDIR